MCPTLSVMTCASVAAFSLSVPYFRICSCASLKVMPTRLRAEVCPVITLPIKLATLTASSCVALRPFCCASKSFIAGMRTLSESFSCRKVATCCAPATCTVPPITPSSFCAEITCLIDATSWSLAPIRCCITVASLVLAISAAAAPADSSFIALCNPDSDAETLSNTCTV